MYLHKNGIERGNLKQYNKLRKAVAHAILQFYCQLGKLRKSASEFVTNWAEHIYSNISAFIPDKYQFRMQKPGMEVEHHQFRNLPVLWSRGEASRAKRDRCRPRPAISRAFRAPNIPAMRAVDPIVLIGKVFKMFWLPSPLISKNTSKHTLNLQSKITQFYRVWLQILFAW